MKNELGRVLEIVEAFRRSGTTRARFARRRGLHPSAFSRILRVALLPPELLAELGRLPRLSRTHLEVLATAPAERRGALLEAVRSGRSSYRIRERRETTAVTVGPDEGRSPAIAPSAAPTAPPLAPLDLVASSLGASPEEALAFASELLLVLWRSGRDRVEGSFRAFRAARAG